MDLYSSATRQQCNDVPSLTANSQVRNYLHFGSFHLDVERRELFRDGLPIRVQSKIIEALLILVEHPGQIITREILRARLWPGDTQINYDANVNTTVNKLRHVLGDSHDRPSYVETIPRRGYTFIADAQLPGEPTFASREQSALATGSTGRHRVSHHKRLFQRWPGLKVVYGRRDLIVCWRGVIWGGCGVVCPPRLLDNPKQNAYYFER